MPLFEFRLKGLPEDLEELSEQQRPEDRDRHPSSKSAKSLLSGTTGVLLIAVAAALVVPLVFPTVSNSPVISAGVLQCGKIRTAFDLIGTIFQLPDSTIKLPDFKTLSASKTVHLQDVEIPAEANGIYPYGVVYRGSFRISSPGSYIFRVTSDDGSKLFIDDRLVINNDGSHAASLVQQGVHLNRGPHTLRLEYFECCGGGAYLSADMCEAKPQ